MILQLGALSSAALRKFDRLSAGQCPAAKLQSPMHQGETLGVYGGMESYLGIFND